MDETEDIRREMVPGSREALEAEHGQVWDTNQLGEDYEVTGFRKPYRAQLALGIMDPLVVVRRKSDGAVGSLTFQHSPRFYFGFVKD